jgi:hypothetical protein
MRERKRERERKLEGGREGEREGWAELAVMNRAKMASDRSPLASL